MRRSLERGEEMRRGGEEERERPIETVCRGCTALSLIALAYTQPYTSDPDNRNTEIYTYKGTLH